MASAVLIAVWLMAIGYGLIYVGISNIKGAPVGLLEGFSS